MGSPQFAVPSLRALIEAGNNVVAVYTQPDREAGRGRQVHSSPVKIAAMELGLPILQPERLRGPGAIEDLRSFDPELIVIVAYGQILRPDVLALPRHGTLNVHASLLPKYRGASPVAGALLHGEAATGVTIMLVDEGLDSGPILSQRSELIRPEDTTASLSNRLATAGAQLLVETLPDWLSGRLRPTAQDESQATLTRRIRKEDGQLDWSRPAEQLWHQIRAYTPWPGALTSIDGVSLQILQAWPVTASGGEVPGTAVQLSGSHEIPAALPAPAFAVQTGDGLLLPLMLKKSGRKALSAREFLNGERGLIGKRLG